jgi:chemotaxis protein methyltransferase CheR
LKTVKVDLMTLDIHMPEMDGVTYLEKNFNKSHPPVIIISSASRSDSDFAMKALKYGASDYIEKPALSNLEEQGEEIRTKMRSIVKDTDRKNTISSFDKENEKKYVISNPEKKVRAILASISDLPKIKYFFSELDNSQPSTFIFFEGQNEILGALTEEHKKDFKQQVVLYEGPHIKIEPNKIYFADFKSWYLEVHKRYTNSPSSLLVLGCVSKHSARVASEWKNAQLLLEDLGEKGNETHPLKAFSTDVVPATSFAYMSCRYLSTK